MLLRSRGGRREDLAAHPIMRKEFNLRSERARKDALKRMHAMTEEQEKREEEVLHDCDVACLGVVNAFLEVVCYNSLVTLLLLAGGFGKATCMYGK